MPRLRHRVVLVLALALGSVRSDAQADDAVSDATVLSPVVTPAALPGPSIVGWRYKWFFVQTEVFEAEDILQVQDRQKTMVKDPVFPSLGPIDGDTKVESRPMLSVGMMFPLKRYVDGGWSIGYMKGPEVTARTTQRNSSVNFVDIIGHHRVRVLRTMSHVRVRRPFLYIFEARLRAGVGVASIDVNFDYQGTGQTVGSGRPYAFAGASGHSRSQNFAWDVAPSLALVSRRTVLDVGLTYADFGPVKIPGGSAHRWHPLGIRVSLEF